MKKYIIWFLPTNQKIKFRQFYTEAPNEQEAIENLRKQADGKFLYQIASITNVDEANFSKGGFIPNTFH